MQGIKYFMLYYGQSLIGMLVADGLAPIWHQNTCNDHDSSSYLVFIRGVSIVILWPGVRETKAFSSQKSENVIFTP